MIGSVLRQLELTRKLIEPALRIVVDERFSLSRLAKALDFIG
jgi:hypothetical protein